MSYEPTNWKDGDLVTSAKLNKLEQGVAAGGGITFVEMDTTTNTLNKTWQEIYDAAQSGMVYLKATRVETNESDASQSEVEADIDVSHSGGISTIIDSLKGFYQNDNEYIVIFTEGLFITTSPNGYPSAPDQSAGTSMGQVFAPGGN